MLKSMTDIDKISDIVLARIENIPENDAKSHENGVKGCDLVSGFSCGTGVANDLHSQPEAREHHPRRYPQAKATQIIAVYQ
jgi:hypothetical protein